MKHFLVAMIMFYIGAESLFACPFCSGMYGPDEGKRRGRYRDDEVSSSPETQYKYSLVMRDLIGGEVVDEGFNDSTSFDLKKTKHHCEVKPSAAQNSKTTGFEVKCTGPSKDTVEFRVDCAASPPQKSESFVGKHGMGVVLIVGSCLE